MSEFQSDIKDKEYITAKSLDFCRKQVLKKAMMQSVPLLNKCSHYNEVNKTGKTRVSFDFRIIPCRKYDGFGNNTYTTFKLDFIEDESEHCDITRLNRPTSFYGRRWDTSPEGYYSFCENKK